MGYAYPVDSKVNIKTDGTIEYDRASNSQDLRGFMKSIITNGIVLKESTNLQVTANEGMKVAVNPGFVVIEGAIKQIEEPIILDVKTSAVYKRVDRIVARLDLNEAVRDIVIDVLQGTEEAETKKQELTRNSSVYELCLAEVLVEGGSTEIKQSNITDTRLLNDVCGMCSSLAEIDTQTLYTQMTTQFDEWFANVKTQLDGDVAGNLQNQIDESKIAENNYFDKNISGMSASNVQGAIDELKGTIGYTSKNLLVNPASNATVNGNVFTANADKSFTVTGTSGTGVTQYYFVQPLKKGKYIASGCPKGGSTSSYWVYVSANNNVLGYDFGEGVEFELEEDTSVTYCMRIFSNGYTANSLVFKPMIRYASIKDDKYEVYVADINTKLQNHDYLDITDKINKSTNCHSLISAYVKNGFVHIKGVINESAVLGQNTWLFVVNDAKYKPSETMYGNIIYRSSADLNKALDVRIQSDGTCYVWLLNDLAAHTYFTLMYPI